MLGKRADGTFESPSKRPEDAQQRCESSKSEILEVRGVTRNGRALQLTGIHIAPLVYEGRTWAFCDAPQAGRRTPAGTSTLRAGAAEFVPGSLPEISEWAVGDDPATKVFNLQELSAQTVALRDGEPPDWADDGAVSVCASEASYFTTGASEASYFTARWLPNDLV